MLLPLAADLVGADKEFADKISGNVLREIVAAVPDSWLEPEGSQIEERRRIYVEYLKRRLAHSDIFLEEAERARKNLV